MPDVIRLGKFVASVLVITAVVVVTIACADDDEVRSDDVAPDAPVETPEAEATSTMPPDQPADDVEETPVTGDDDAADTPPGGAQARLQDIDIELELFADGFIQPTDMVAATDGTERLFVISRTGVIHVVEDGQVREEPLLDIQERVEHEMVEQGMLSMALHRDFVENGYFYVNYISYGDENTIISRFQMSDDGERALPDSEMLIMEVEQPHYSHNGGNLKFGPDGYLYIGLGDGEDPGDPHGNSQDPDTLLGAILRIDVDSETPYAVPPDNPFVDDPDGRDEVWAFGLRNPWRFSWDDRTGDLYIVDVGQWAVEEINVQPPDSTGGENYGWPIMEGDECWEADECDTEGLTMPVVTYRNPDEGCAIIGGYAYYGSSFPDLEGVYFFGDWCSGNIWGMLEENGEWVHERLLETDLMINAFGRDHDGEIYVLGFEDGAVHRIVANQP